MSNHIVRLAAAGLLLFSTITSADRTRSPIDTVDLEPSINGEVSASGLFPTQAMEDQFQDYLEWTSTAELSRFHVFDPTGNSLEPALDGAVSPSGLFPTQAMEEQFNSYLEWTQSSGLTRFYAFEADFRG